MGQYYKPYLRDGDGNERTFNPHNAEFMAVHGIKSADEIPDDLKSWDFDDPTSYGSLNNGYKLMEHSWMGNGFVDGVLEAIEDNPCTLAWVGDYATSDGDFDDRYTRDVYGKVWGWANDGGDSLPDMPFGQRPAMHEAGFVVNVTKGIYIDLVRYRELAGYSLSYDKERTWCVHPLPLLTAIGNGRGGGDYWERNPNSEHVGDWAMDTIYFTEEMPTEYVEADYSTVTFKEED